MAYDAGAVAASVNGNIATIGNGAIERTFSIAEGGQVKTAKIDNKRAGTTLTPGEGSEEFIIKRTKKDGRVQQPIDQTGWTAEADSEEPTGEDNGSVLETARPLRSDLMVSTTLPALS